MKAVFSPVRLAAFNILLLLLCLGSLFYYISGSNAAAADEYRLSALRQEIIRLTEERGILESDKSSMENPAAAALFARHQQMVEAKDIVYVFENNNVALQK
ncbi:MAG: hypothetical protein A2669_02845 [Candidatus Yanofskybacteria bacterium RIFCSPHIGHO2_01_FULL_48_25b]|uniref:Septum formation initiator n=1 Tax=Candidatus Yanofskybacteria bacterium RIFCSPHIGHO2_01_FULL_48_25b TaxID=1802672 RepID=A0A1F8F2T0_9BACT|nr:MAG: hypothetical protein A2669_02845 [Candidatus Yanofskybacteria bacterium RIFCSPHIGHO2_01_FULL_48_25b]